MPNEIIDYRTPAGEGTLPPPVRRPSDRIFGALSLGTLGLIFLLLTALAVNPARLLWTDSMEVIGWLVFIPVLLFVGSLLAAVGTSQDEAPRLAFVALFGNLGLLLVLFGVLLMFNVR